MSAMESIDTRSLASKAREITQRELGVYMQRTAGSMKATERARKVMPLGVPSSFQAYDPHPIVVKRAQAAWMEDVDGNRYVDFDLGFGALFAGHCNPAVRSAIEAQLDDGTLFVTPCELNSDVAEMLAARYKLPMWRFTNSGTEATMDAIRVARGVTGRDKIVKVEGGYHGHHDSVEVSVLPEEDEVGPADNPARTPGNTGIPEAIRDLTLVVSFNDVAMVRRVLEANPGRVAGMIIEPVMMNAGIILPREGYLAELKEVLHAHDALFAFDEVKTGFTAGPGGVTAIYGVTPD
ncbi:MAG TPA: aminotransferase class III-fold pyridoxal phosphate-dependent enzyme, partial [Ilumatobacteraceae bacterium]